MANESEFTSVAPAAIETRPVTTDPTHEYIGSSVEYGYWNVDRVLPQSIDDAERLYGPDIYDRMVTDPLMAGIERVMKVLVLADGLSILPSHSRPIRSSATQDDIANYEHAKFYSDYVGYCIARLEEKDEPIEETLYNLLDGPRLGHQLAEVTYESLAKGAHEGKVAIESISCKPRRNYAFAMDPWNRLVGVLAIVPGVSPMLWTGIVQDPSRFPNCLAPEKVLIFSLERRNRNPQGVSWFRGCYDPWQRKQTQKKNTVNAGTQTGGGLVTAIAPQIDRTETFWDPASQKEVTQTQAIYNALRHLGSGKPGVFPFGTQIEVHQPPSANSYFDWFFDYADREIVTSFLLSSRSILEAKHGSKADVSNSQDLLDELKVFVRGRLCMLLSTLGRRLLRMSFGEDVARKFAPKFSMQKVSRPDFAANCTAVGSFLQGTQRAGFDLAPNQVAYFLQEVLGAPAPDMDANASTDANEVPGSDAPPAVVS